MPLRASASPRETFSAALRLPTLGYTVDFPLDHCAFARVFCCRVYFSTDFTDFRRFKLQFTLSDLSSPLLPSAAVSSAQMSAASFQSTQHAGDRSQLAGIGGQKMKRTQARLWKFAFLIATFVQRMRPRASAASGEMDPNAGMGLEETSAPPSVGSETNLKQNFDQVKLAAEPKQRKFTQSVQAAEGVMRAQLCKFCLKTLC